MSVSDAPTLAQVLLRQGALSPAAALVALREIAVEAAAREATGTLIGALTVERIQLERTGRTRLADAAIVADGDAPALPPPQAIARLGVAMLRGGTDGTPEDAVVPARVRGGQMPTGFSRVLSQGLAGEVGTAAEYSAALQAVPLRPEDRRQANEQLNQMAVRAWTLAPQSGGATRKAPVEMAAAPPPPAWRRWAIIGALCLATAAAWWQREQLFGNAATDDAGAATLALARRSQRLRATTDADSLPVDPVVVDSAAVRDSAAARVAGAASSGTAGGEAEASLAGDPLIEGIKALEAGRTREAIPLLQRAAGRDAEDAAPHGYLACAHRRLGQHADADRALARTAGTPGPWVSCARKVGG